MFCTSCGCEFADGAPACRSCGTANVRNVNDAASRPAPPARIEVTLDDEPAPSVEPTAPPSTPRVVPPASHAPPPPVKPGPGLPPVPPSGGPPPLAYTGPVIPVYNVGPPRNNGMAIASMVTGLASLAFCYLAFVPAIVAVVLGFVAKGHIRASNGAEGGDGMANAGIILGFVWIGMTIAAIIVAASSS